MIRINVKITNAIGEWHGFLQTEADLTPKEANDILDNLIKNANNLRHLAIVHDNESQTT